MSKKFVKVIVGLVILGLVVVGGAFWWVNQQLQPVSTTDKTKKRFVIGKGQSLIKTATALQEAGLIRNAQVFRYYVQFKKLDTKMQSGSYELAPNMPVVDLAQTLTEGSEDIWITLLEGWRTDEVVEYLSEQDLSAFDIETFIDLSENSEGMIFPDTYLVPRESTAEQLYSLFTNTFNKKVEKGLAEDIKKSEFTFAEISTLASLVEREARSYEDMRIVSGILQNRLKIGMPLQVDATLQYLAGEDETTHSWWEPPSIELKQSTSLFNTYKYPGLPPGPICNPGLNAFKAVLDPVASDDLFYLHAPSGEMYYSETLDEHNANVNRYLR